MKKCIFQLISAERGVRTPVIVCTSMQFIDEVIMKDTSVLELDYVLVLMENDGDGWEFSTAPLMRCLTFVSRYSFVESDHG